MPATPVPARAPGSRRFIVGAAIGSGITALAAERGGADLLLALNAGRFRAMGAPSIACMLPIFDAAAMTATFSRREVLSQCQVPVLLGINVWDDRGDVAERALAVRDAGFAGAVNFPSAMHYARPMQQILSRAGRGIEREVEQLRAVQDLGMTAMFYCATRTQARLAADAGIHMVCLNLGWNVGGLLGHRHRASIEEVATVAREIGRLVKRIHPDTRFLLEGGPIASAADLGRVAALAPIDGYVGGSTIERIPLERSVADQIDRFRRAGARRVTLDAAEARLVTWAARLGFSGRGSALRAFLRPLQALAAGRAPLLLAVERGGDTRATLAALARSRRGRGNSVCIDLAGEEFPARARRLLFGHRELPAWQRPALADDEGALLLVQAPERLPLDTQSRLLRALREGEFRVTGTRTTLPVTARVVLVVTVPSLSADAASDLVGAGLSEALVGFLRGGLLRLPPLRERVEDLVTLVERYSADAAGRPLGRGSFSADAMKLLLAHRWPGNEEELSAVLSLLAAPASRGVVQAADLQPLLVPAAVSDPARGSEKDLIVDALWRNGFNRTRTAAALGMARKTLYNKIRKYGLSG